jgi:hypothetical protein
MLASLAHTYFWCHPSSVNMYLPKKFVDILFLIFGGCPAAVCGAKVCLFSTYFFQTSVPWSFSNLYHYFLKNFTFSPCYFRELELHYILEWAHCIWKNRYCSQPWGLYLIQNYIFNWTITKYLNICKLWFFLLTCQFRSIWYRNIRLRSSHAFLFLKKQYINEQYISYCDALGFFSNH